ncbi:DUF4367 domain-containing protein [Bacillus sp. CGMCC 1.16607]|uniref:outer membrane lipoprotein-sorting protein n=1 Tax=Bacillus sp. CGMCC 1.16607 TaxID=3351842 RepID=UPI003641162D
MISFTRLGIIGILFVILLSGCSQNRLTSYDQMMEEIIEYRMTTQIPDSYYIETETTIYENNKVQNQNTSKHWYEFKTGKERIETMPKGQPVQYSVYDGDNRIIYTDGDAKAVVMESQNNPLTKPKSMIDSIIQMLQEFSSTHEIKLVGEKEIDGAPTYHLKLKAKDQRAIFGDKELWINQETWMMKKMVSVIGNERQETLFKVYKANPSDLTEKFTLELPEGVEKIEEPSARKFITLDEMKTYFNQSFYYFPSSEDIQIESVEESKGVISLSYTKEKQLTYFTVFMRKISETDMKIQGDHMIRGNEAQLKKENGNGYSLSWSEDGIQYTIYDLANVVKKEEIMKIANAMKKF